MKTTSTAGLHLACAGRSAREAPNLASRRSKLAACQRSGITLSPSHTLCRRLSRQREGAREQARLTAPNLAHGAKALALAVPTDSQDLVAGLMPWQ